MNRVYLILLLISAKSFSQSSIDEWKLYPIPSIDSIFKYNNSDTSWFVTLSSDGKVMAQNKIATWSSPDKLPFKTAVDTNPPFKKRGFQTVKKVVNGYLVGYNRGEWGGDLFWYSFKGDSNYRITHKNVVAIEEMNSKLYLIDGLAHLSFSGGAIRKLELITYKWQITKTTELPTAPDVVIHYKNKLLVITSNDIVIFDNDEKLETLKKGGFWDILYPQSAVIKNEILYVGMRGGIYQFDLKTQKENWLMPE